jgi:hypothetical protein
MLFLPPIACHSERRDVLADVLEDVLEGALADVLGSVPPALNDRQKSPLTTSDFRANKKKSQK